MMKQILSLLLLIFVVQVVIAQTPSQDVDIKKIIPLTPNAASLGKYGNIPIGLYTGQPNVNFPLYEIAYNDLTIPINLSYNYSGLKVEEYPSWVGTGWALTGTGVISRQVRGLADEKAAGYNGSQKNGEKVIDFIANGNYNPTMNSFLDGLKDGNKDGEPDMFVLSMPGHSAKFFFDETQCNTTIKQATVIPHQKLKIIGYFNYTGIYNIRPGIIEKFEVTDERGIKYTFDITEKAAGVELGDPDEEDFANSWYLREIESPNGNYVNYQYHFRTLDMPPTLFERRIIPFSTDGDFTHNISYNSSSMREAILDRVTFRNGFVDFIEGEERLDWNSDNWSYSKHKATEQPKTLSKIKVNVNGKLIKEIQLTYSYFGSISRLRLDSFQEKNGNITKPPYTFTYFDGLFPTIGEENSLFHQDHWGYYLGSSINGEPITTLLPPYFNAIPNINGSYTMYSLPGNNRTPNPLSARSGILKRISYPTGGSTEFEYEPNEYWGKPDFNLCGGDFKLTNGGEVSFLLGSESDVQQFTVGITSCIKFTYTIEAPCIDGEAGVNIQGPSGTMIMRHIVSNKMWGMDYSDMGPGQNELYSLEPGTYTMTAWGINENTCGSLTKASIKLFRIIQDPLGFANLKAGGLRIKNVKDCDYEESCITKNYSYLDLISPERSSGVIINSPVYEHYQIVRFDSESAGGQTNHVDVNCITLTSQSQVPIATTSGSVIGYKYVTVTEEQDGSKGKSEFEFTTAIDYPDNGSSQYPFPPRVSNDWKRGTQLLKRDYNGTQGPQSILNIDSSVPCITNTYYRAIAIKPKKLFDTQGSYLLKLVDFDFEPYTFESGWLGICNQDQTSYSYFNGIQQALVTQKSMFYESPAHLQVTRIETTNSKGEILKSTLKYIGDVASVVGLTPAEQAGIQAHPNKLALVEQQQFNGASLLSTTRNIYNGPILSKVQFATGSNQLEDYVNYNAYDDYNNVKNYTTWSGENKSYIWDNNGMYPLAEAVNASPNDIYFTSFETNGIPFVDSNGNNKAISGTKVLNSGSFTFPGNFQPTDPPNTLMSYWYWQDNQWNFSNEIPYSINITTSATMLDEIRAFPKGAFLTTLTNEPGMGTTSITDANGQSTHYEYDLLGRLLFIRDHDGNILKEFKYHYYNEQN
ncbi:MAG TPA: RHS repeat protein [Cyclobacteriaceae bacterium]|nr:RHS repeat protein [Cyclobacteriaceae bacterium]